MPESHRQAGEWTPERLISTARNARKHLQQAYHSCLGILRLGQSYGEARLKAACWRTLMQASC
jgi:hypothetical protein